MEEKKILNQLSAYQQGKQIDEIKDEYQLERIVKLASNENPFGYSNHLKEFLSDYIHAFNIYPDGHVAELRQKVATTLNVKESQLVFGSGSDEIIKIICQTFLYPGVNTIMATPTFSQYKHNALIEGAAVKEIQTKSGYHCLDSMLQSIDDNTKIVWICSPDNPTGTLPSRDNFVDFMEKCPENVMVVLDEAYYEYVDDNVNLHALSYLTQYKNLVLLRTFSKAYGLAGLRIGYGIMNEKIANKLNVVRGPFNTSSIAQTSALVALDDTSFIQETVTKNQTTKQSFQHFLNEIGWKYYESQANFILVSTPISGTEVFQFLLENGYIVRPGELLGYPNTIRITIGEKQDMIQLQELLNKLHLQLNNGV